MIELSVVLICKNQAWNIPRLIESVLQATSSILDKEIILVDSASTDETVELACRYPINVLRLQPAQHLSPAAGRYIGYQRTRGEFVLFLDGDMELVQEWLTPALRVMRETPQAAVVTGQVMDLLPSEVPKPTPPAQPRKAPKEVTFGGGAALYRRAVLEKVETFNPFLNSDEEPELCLRIRHAGYRVLQLDCPIVRHYTYVPETFSALLSRRRRKFLLGVGQCLRCHLGDELFWPYLRERALWSLGAVFWLAAGLAAILWALATGDYIWFGLWTVALGLLIADATRRKRSLRRGLACAFHRLLMVEGLLRGFLRKPLSPEKYRWKVEAVERFRPGERPVMADTGKAQVQGRGVKVKDLVAPGGFP